MERILWALTWRIMELHEYIWDMCEVLQMNKKSESTQGNLDDVWHERRNCEKDNTSHRSLNIVCFQLRETTHDEKLEGQGTN
jgi:hypothetical protein